MATHFDIEERKQAEGKLQRSEAYLRKARSRPIRQLGNGPVDWKLPLIREHSRLFGFDPEQVSVTRRTSPEDSSEDLDRVVETYDRAAGKQENFEWISGPFFEGTMKYIHSAAILFSTQRRPGRIRWM